MALITLSIPDSMCVPPEELREFVRFLQLMCNRRAVGFLRYGKITQRHKYMIRLQKEFDRYKQDGNMEQLLNVAVYAFLESYAPQNKKWHFDNNVASATRKPDGRLDGRLDGRTDGRPNR